MPRKTFDNELGLLKQEFVEMGTLIEEAIENSIKALTDGDEQLAREVCENDRYVNVSEKTIQSHALMLMLRQQPVARDLRAVSSALRAATDMERIGDQAADIAELTLRLAKNGEPRTSSRIIEMAQTAVGMVKACVSAFAAEDTEMAKRVIELDDRLDVMFSDITKDIAHALRKTEDDVDLCIDLLMIAKHFEKIGDHAVNIARWTIFGETGMLDNVKLI